MRASTTFFLNTSATSIFINFVTRSGGTWRKSRTRFYRLWKASSATEFDGPRLQKHLNKFAQFCAVWYKVAQPVKRQHLLLVFPYWKRLCYALFLSAFSLNIMENWLQNITVSFSDEFDVSTVLLQCLPETTSPFTSAVSSHTCRSLLSFATWRHFVLVYKIKLTDIFRLKRL